MAENFPESQKLPEIVYDVHHLKRGGGHAVIGYLLGCLEASGKTATHVNDVEPVNPAKMPISAKEALAQATGSTALVISHEDTYFWLRDKSLTREGLQMEGVPLQDLVVIRDWYNMVASWMIKFDKSHAERFQTGTSITGGHTKKMLWLEMASIATDPYPAGMPIVINYNQWFSNAGYRGQIANTLCMELATEEVLNSVMRNGNGSSVDGLAFDGRAQQMNVLHRWRNLRPELVPAYRNYILERECGGICLRHEIDGFNRDLFGFGLQEVLLDIENS